MIKVCFHVHSEYSYDSLLSLEKIAETAEKNKIDVVVITDHDNLVPEEEIEKTLLLRQLADTGGQVKKVRIIRGEEILTSGGEIIGIFLKEKIEFGFSPEETIMQIKKQGGLVIIPHPFDRLRPNKLKENFLLSYLKEIDIIEVFNSRTHLEIDNKRALQFARKNNKTMIVGSDAHSIFEIDKALIEMEDFKEPQDFLEKLKKAKFFTQKASVFVHFISMASRILKKI